MIYMLGGAGYHNFGDELMVRCWLDYFRRYHPGQKVWIDGASRSALRQAFEADYPEIGFTDVINGLAQLTADRPFWGHFQRGLTFFARGGFDAHPGLRRDAQPMMDADVIHLHGGGYLNIHFAPKAFLMGLAIAVSRRTGARLIGTGLGLLPLRPPADDDRDTVADALRQFDLLETRDTEGAHFLTKLAPGATIVSGVDDTFLGPLRYQAAPGRALHLSWDEARLESAEFARVGDYLDAHHADYDRIYFWRCARNDAGSWRHLSKRVPGIEQLPFEDLLMKPFPINPGDHMLTTRFHPHLIGARGGAVGGFATDGQYYDIKHGSITKLGSGFFPISGHKAISPQDFGRTANTLAARTPEYRVGKLGQTALFYGETARLSDSGPRAGSAGAAPHTAIGDGQDSAAKAG